MLMKLSHMVNNVKIGCFICRRQPCIDPIPYRAVYLQVIRLSWDVENSVIQVRGDKTNRFQPCSSRSFLAGRLRSGSSKRSPF